MSVHTILRKSWATSPNCPAGRENSVGLVLCRCTVAGHVVFSQIIRGGGGGSETTRSISAISPDDPKSHNWAQTPNVPLCC